MALPIPGFAFVLGDLNRQTVASALGVIADENPMAVVIAYFHHTTPARSMRSNALDSRPLWMEESGPRFGLGSGDPVELNSHQAIQSHHLMKPLKTVLRPFANWILLHLLLALPGSIFAQSHAPKSTLFYIPHTHWEGAVF